MERALGAQKTIGLVEWFRPGECDRVERALEDCRVLGVKALRTAVSWADWHTRAGQAWYSWLLPRLAAEIDLLKLRVEGLVIRIPHRPGPVLTDVLSVG